MIGIIFHENIWFAPYIKIYTDIFDRHSIEYEIVSWNRDGRDEKQGIQFERRLDNAIGRFNKLGAYLSFVKFVKKTIKEKRYDKLVVIGPQLAIFLADFLEKHYNNRYIIDYRDLSIEQKWFLKRKFAKALRNSFANVISSPGFKRCLPEGEYYISHNFDIEKVRHALLTTTDVNLNKDEIDILTIGGIRDYSSNSEMIKSLANVDGIKLGFVGKGIAAEALEDLSNNLGAKNIYFKGYYRKEDEPDYIKGCTFLNIYYPRIISHSTALSNRFYNSLIYKKPMIVTTDSIQGEYAEKYGVGLVLANCDNIVKDIKEYINNFNTNDYIQNCNNLLEIFIKDYERHERMLLQLYEIQRVNGGGG